jgi:hopanoid C-2 methylase
VNRIVAPARGKLTWHNLSGAAVLAFRVMFYIGILSDYRKPFWRAARHALRRGQIDAVLGMGFIAHHLIQFTREALRGEQNASFYSQARKKDARAGCRNASKRNRCANRPNRRNPAESARSCSSPG